MVSGTLGMLSGASKPQALNLSSALPRKAIILILTHIVFLPMHFAEEKVDTTCRVCGWRYGLQFLLAGPPPTHACWPCSDHPTASPRECLVHELDTTGELLVDLGSDQTSCHNPFNGGYYPVQLSFSEAQSLMSSNPAAFKHLVQERWVTGRDAQGGTAEPT